jgi:ABC-type transporter Mla MlaB component
MEKAGGSRCRKTAAQPREINMLRITVTETAVEERWILHGQLTKRSVGELVSSWRASLTQPPSLCRIVDLNEVTSIDKSGEEALLMMVRDGATFVASGVYTKHLLDQLQARQTNQQHLD